MRKMRFKTYIEGLEEEVHMFCDMDGVLTNWELHFQNYHGKSRDDMTKKEGYAASKKLPVEWWATMPWMPDGKELWSYLSEHFESLRILSAPTQDVEEKAIKGKWAWLTEQGFVDQLGKENIIIDAEKHKYVMDSGMSILVDDNEKKIANWRKAGGVGILHTSASNSIKELNKHLHI
jgi:hypothetical protein